jgi:hypothetical protein
MKNRKASIPDATPILHSINRALILHTPLKCKVPYKCHNKSVVFTKKLWFF